MSEFRGARGSNTGDDFHELWATRQAIRLLANEDGLEAIAVEGLGSRDEAGAPADTWDGVDCTLYFGGRDANAAKNVRFEQLKYSAANPKTPWTVARLVAGTRRDRSVIARLAKAWKGLVSLRPTGPHPGAVLISNQPIDPAVLAAVARATASPTPVPSSKPKDTATPEARMAYATGLNAKDFQAFSASMRIEAGAGSRFALEERVLRAIADWTDQDVQRVVTGLRQFVRQRMRPEFVGELITRESVMLHFGASEGVALFPCPSDIAQTQEPVSRAPVRNAARRLLSDVQYLCLHGGGGVGKTTALQEIQTALPTGSVMLNYDCYGGGRYLDPSALRHRSTDAFLQLTNELATKLQLPLLLSRHQGSDYPRLFANRLTHAADALAVQHPGAVIVIAVDAADNAVTAAQSRTPVEPSFVHDFVLLTGQPENVRFVVTARTGRLAELRLPASYERIEIEPFSRIETGENVARVWDAPEPWTDDFHHLSSGVPRVQAYAFEGDDEHPSTSLDRLRPGGKSLDEVFRQQFRGALSKSGNPTEVARLCAGLIALARPVPLLDLAGVLGSTEAQLADICADLAPGIRLRDGLVSFADEDFEQFVRIESGGELSPVQQSAASWLLSRSAHDRYAALNAAAALAVANRGVELLDLVEREPAPLAVSDPVLRREAELQRLRLAIKVCREAGDVARALRFVLIGAEGIKTESAIREMLVSNPDLAARFAQETSGRLILSDPDHVEDHGPLLFQKLSVDADRGDAISVREGRRLLRAWLQARDHHRLRKDEHQSRVWEISISDIASSVEAALKIDGAAASLEALGSWTPKRVALDVAWTLPSRLIAEGRADDIEAIVTNEQLRPRSALFLLNHLALAGRPFDVDRMAVGLAQLSRSRLRLQHFFDGHHDRPSAHGHVLDTALTACEILASKGAAPALVDSILDSFLAPELRRVDRRHTHESMKLDFIFRAHALREARAGRTPKAEGAFEPRPTPLADSKRRPDARSREEHDRPLMELSSAVFGIYAAVAHILVNQQSDAERDEALRRGIGGLEREEWRISRRHGSGALRGHAAKNLLVLLAVGHDARLLKSFATEVHGRWRCGYELPNEQFVVRLSLRQELHGSLLKDLAAAAAETRKMRIGADEKSKTLVSYARLLKPISISDANAVFNEAVEAASELDREAMAQIRLFDRLTARGGSAFSDARRTAQHFGDIVADAGVRLDGYDHFPWDEAMSVLTRLDAPLALASVARWDDANVATTRETLTPVLKTGLSEKTIRPAQAASLALFLDGDDGILDEALATSDKAGHASFPALAEEAAYDVLIRHDRRRGDEITPYIERRDLKAYWASALVRQERFISTLPPEPLTRRENTFASAAKTGDPLDGHAWTRETLTDPQILQSTIEDLQERGRAERSYVSLSTIFESANAAVAPRDRAAHIEALAGLERLTITNEAVKALLDAIDLWWDSPAVQAWCKTSLAEVIVRRLPELTRYLEHGQDDLTSALTRTGLTESGTQDLILRGIERHVEAFGSDLIFALAAMVGYTLESSDAAGLVDWYVERLAERIPAEDRDQVVPRTTLPQHMDEAVARFLFAYMGDYDLRLRWRAAHAARRLARTNDKATLLALAGEYERREEPAFRGRELAFYWLAARLWFVIAWDRIAGERPELAGQVGSILLRIALNEAFPHLLVRSFARDACEKLTVAGHLSLNIEESSRLALGHVDKA